MPNPLHHRFARQVCRLAGRVSFLASVAAVAALAASINGCAHKAISPAGKTVAAPKNGTSPPTDKPAAPPAEEDALVKVKDKMFPPVDVGSWVCEPKSWSGKEQAVLHCTAPAGTKGLIEALKRDPAVADAQPAK